MLAQPNKRHTASSMNICNDIWFCLDRYGIVVGDLLMTITIGAAIYGFIRRENIRGWFVRNRFPDVGGELIAQSEPIDAIVFLVSKTEVPRWVLRQLRPAQVGFVATAQSLKNAQVLDAEARAAGLRVHQTIEIDDPDDPADTRQAVMQMINRLRDAEAKEIAVDLTGGKTPMSLGAFMAAEELAVQTIYVAADFDPTLNKPRMDTARVMRISRPK